MIKDNLCFDKPREKRQKMKKLRFFKWISTQLNSMVAII